MIDSALRLRGHHLLCMLTYIGQGYTQVFSDSFSNKMKGISEGTTEIEIVYGAKDDLCQVLQCDPSCPADIARHCLEGDAARRDDMALATLSAFLRLPLKAGYRLRLTPEYVRILRQEFAAGTIRQACAGCEWFDLCTAVAREGYRGVKLFPPKYPSLTIS